MQLFFFLRRFNKAVVKVIGPVGFTLATCWHLAMPTLAHAIEAEAQAPLGDGLVVEAVGRGWGADKAGIRPGDLLLRWSRGNRRDNRFRTPFDLTFIRIEEASRGAVIIEGMRGARIHRWVLGPEYWNLRVCPRFKGELLATYLEGQRQADSGNRTGAIDGWQRVATLAGGAGISWLKPWLLSHAALVFGIQWSGFDDAYRAAIEESTTAEVSIRADLMHQWATSFPARGDLEGAKVHTEEALRLWREFGRAKMEIATQLGGLGYVEFLLGNLANAEQDHREALVLADQTAPQGIQAMLALHNLAVTFQTAGDFASAEKYYQTALAIGRTFFPETFYFAQLLTDYGTLTLRKGDLSGAEQHYRKALAIDERLNPDGLEIAVLLGYLSGCLLDRGDFEGADRLENRAQALREKMAPNSVDVVRGLLNLGRLSLHREEQSKAKDYYVRALAMSQQLDAPEETARASIGLGSTAMATGEFAEAGRYYQRALSIIERFAPNSLIHAETLSDLASVLRSQKQFGLAAQTYEYALKELEGKASHLGGADTNRVRYRAKHEQSYRAYVNVLLEEEKPDLAFQAIEASRARTLLESLAQGNVDVHRGGDPDLLAHEKKVRQLLSAKSAYQLRILGGKHTEEQVEKLNIEIAELLDQDQHLEAEIRDKSPRYAALSHPKPLDLAQLQQLLDPETILLEYSLEDDRSHVWVVTNQSLSVYEIPKRKDIDDLAHKVYQLLTIRNRRFGKSKKSVLVTPAQLARADTEYIEAAGHLSRTILGPVASLLGQKRLVIVADGALQSIPFAALPIPQATYDASKIGTPAGQESRGDVPVPLIAQHEVVILPSLSVVAELRRQESDRKKASKAVAVLADPVFRLTDERVQRRMSVSRQKERPGTESSAVSPLRNHITRFVADMDESRSPGFALSRLLYSRAEAEAIMSVTPPGEAMKALDFQASRALAMSPALAKYRVVHFATHGLLDNKHPELSGLILSLVDSRGEQQDGLLELNDIYNMNLPVELVVLSGCQTGLGEDIDGEGIIGLTRGFMYAGASRVMASLWSVSDAGTAKLMARFYWFMEKGGMRPAAALRAAQIEMWKSRSWRDPYYWAAFQIQGEWK